MHKLKFKDTKGFQRMMRWMREHPRKIPYENATTDGFGVWLVKDDGIYIMAPSEQRDMDGEGVHVIYAKGYDRDQDDIWDKTYAVSGDDFVEFIPLTPEQVSRLEHKGGDLDIGISETALEIRA